MVADTRRNGEDQVVRLVLRQAMHEVTFVNIIYTCEYYIYFQTSYKTLFRGKYPLKSHSEKLQLRGLGFFKE